jgi:hypothetical protein
VALSLTRGRVCRLQLPLVLASEVIRDHILLSQILNFPFRRILQLSGLRWRYWTPPPHGILPHCSNCPGYNFSARTTYETQFIFCCVHILCRGNVFTEPLTRNGCCLLAYLAVVAGNGCTRYNIILSFWVFSVFQWVSPRKKSVCTPFFPTAAS